MCHSERQFFSSFNPIFHLFSQKARDKVNVGIRNPYFRVLGVQVDTDGSGRSAVTTFNASDEEEMRTLAASPNIYDTVAKSIAPSIYGSIDIKKAIACLLFGGSRKRLEFLSPSILDIYSRRNM